MRAMRIARFAIAAAVVALASLTAGCTLPDRGTPPGPICYAADANLIC